jgi:hypothetical protein
MIIVEVDDLLGELIDAVVGGRGELLSLIGLLTGGQGLLVGACGLSLDSLNPLLGPLIGIADAASRLRGLNIQLIDLVNHWGRLLLDIRLGSAPCGKGHCANGKNWEKKAFH